MRNNQLHVAFVSANVGGGGSEELWIQTAIYLAENGNHVTALTTWSSGAQHRINQLVRNKIPWVPLQTSFTRKLLHKFSRAESGTASALRGWIKKNSPDWIVFNSGTAYDGLDLLEVITQSDIPSLAVTHLVSEANWPDDKTAELAASLFSRVRSACFVSHHNKTLFEMQCACELKNSRIVRNPFLVRSESPLPWPTLGRSPESYRLAFPARLHPRTKGQDILIQVLSSPKWKDRPIHVDLYGTGPSAKTLEKLSHQRCPGKIRFCGHANDIEEVWRHHHALVLPSRHEGLPICLVEAMMVGRPAFIQPAGGSAEVMIPGRTGLVSDSCTIQALDSMMEEAWTLRTSWEEMGRMAARHIRTIISPAPERQLAQLLAELVE